MTATPRELKETTIFGVNDNNVVDLHFKNKSLQGYQTAKGGCNQLTTTVTGLSVTGSNEGDPELSDYYLIGVQLNISSAAGFTQHHKGKTYGVYLESADVSARALTQEKCVIYKSMPETTISSETYSDSVGFSLSHSVGAFGDMPTTNTTAGVSVRHGKSWTVQDLSITNNSTAYDPKWHFQVNNLPKKGGKEGINLSLNGPPKIATSDLQLHLAWIWEASTKSRSANTNNFEFELCTQLKYGYRHVKHDKIHGDIHDFADAILVRASMPFNPINQK